MSATNNKNRIIAIDALRGFDMFWLTGGLSLFLACSNLAYSPLPDWIKYHTKHVPWIGFSAWDLVMPLFIFIVGTAMPFSLCKRKQESSLPRIYGKIFKRVAILFALGMCVQGNLLLFDPEKIKIYSNTLQAIASGYLIAAICLLHLRFRWHVIISLGLLIIYWALMKWVPYGGNEAGTLLPRNNLALHIDTLIFGSFRDGTTYAWFLPQLSFGALTLLGAIAGQIIQQGDNRKKNFFILTATGLFCLLTGYLWGFGFPIIKHIFSSSMVLWSAGWCFLLLALFYLLTDIYGLVKWAFPFQVIGSNAIFVYLWVSLCPPDKSISKILFGGFSSCFGSYSDVIFYSLNYALIFGVLLYLYKKKTFIKI